MSYQWHPDAGEMFALPAAVADNVLRLAGRTQFKVLLWFARHPDEFDVDACAKAVGEKAADCEDALAFWQEVGVLTSDNVQKPAPAKKSADKQKPTPGLNLPPITPAGELPKKPQMPQVLERQKASAEFAYLLRTAETRVGRPITPGEMQTFLYIYDTLGLPAEVILMMLVSAVSRGKAKSVSGFKGYLEKMAVSWSENGITTVAAAEEELLRGEKRDRTRERLKEALSLAKTPTLMQVEAAQKWFDEWHFSDDMLRAAYDRCKEKTGGFNAVYITRILEGWYVDGITTPERAAEAAEPRKKAAGKPLLSDDTAPAASSDAYEQAVAAYTPKYKKKSAKE